jgi:myosin heavy subunit
MQGVEVWVPSEKESWIEGKVTSDNGQLCTVSTKEGRQQMKIAEVEALERVIKSTITKVFSNLVELEAFSEGAILYQMRKRYENDEIYTYVGKILTAINPFKRLPIYTEKKMVMYRKQAGTGQQPPDPHVFAIGAMAYHEMKTNKQSQSVLISGESGAGKTETTKKVLQYLAFVAGSGMGVEKQILQSNPVTEAFGNAKTLRNNNSSRFGKWMKIDFDRANTIIGCEIVNYLLETSRVTIQSKGERNYHFFYMMCVGASPEEKAKYFLQGPENYQYLNKSGCIKIETGEHSDDHHEWKETIEAVNTLEFSAEEMHSVLCISSAVLLLGNLEFVSAGGDEDSTPKDMQVLSNAATLLGCDPDQMKNSLTVRKLTMRGRSSVTMIPLPPKKAKEVTDAMAKALYSKQFDWLIQRVNKTLVHPGGFLHCGVLDIFGFEVFQENYFEQMCINYANEKLQSHFNDMIFKAEIGLYEAEGVPVDQIVFEDNSKCLCLIEDRKCSILSLLNEELVIPKATDDTYVSKLHRTFGEKKSPGFEHYKRNVKQPKSFIIRHFAGEVQYTSQGMLEKNKDEVSAEVVELMTCSSLELGVKLFTEEPEDLGGTRSKKKLKTIAGKFKAQLASLMTMLHETSPHFIRCVKPNSKQTFQMWEAPLCLRQLKYAGLFEAIRIRKAGYAFRIPHETFFRRYAIVVPGLERNRPDDVGDACRMLLQKLPKPLAPEEWVVGKTKVFLKSNAGRTAVEKMLNGAVLQYVVKLQSFFRNSLEMVRANREIFARRKEQQERERKLALERKKREEEEAAARLKKEEGARLEREEAERVERELREEEERRRKARRIKIDSAITIQRVARGKSARNTMRRAQMIKALKVAMRSGDERQLENAIKEALRVQVDCAEGDYSAELLSEIKDSQVLRERLTQQRMLKQQLKKAVETEDLPLLKRALQALQQTFPEFSQTMPEAVEARGKLSELKAKDAARQRLQDLCNLDMSMVVDNGDQLEEAIAKAEDLGLALNPKQVRLLKKAQDLFSSAKPKLTVRDKIREAVEVADLGKIEESQLEMKTMMEEEKSTFCLPEMRAAKMMLKMFMFERQLSATSNKPLTRKSMDFCKQIYDARGDGGRKELQRKLYEEVRLISLRALLSLSAHLCLSLLCFSAIRTEI